MSTASEQPGPEQGDTHYSEFRLFSPACPRSLRDGFYDHVESRLEGVPDEIAPGTLFIDERTGALHACEAESGGDLFSVLGLADLRDALIEPAQEVALVDYDPEIVDDLVRTAIGDKTPIHPRCNIVVLPRVDRQDVVRLLIRTLIKLAQQNRGFAGDELVKGFTMSLSTAFGEIRVLRSEPLKVGHRYMIDYTNYEGRRSSREIEITGFAFGANAYHTVPGLMIEALDVARGVPRTFTTDDRARIHGLVAHAQIDDRVADIVA